LCLSSFSFPLFFFFFFFFFFPFAWKNSFRTTSCGVRVEEKLAGLVLPSFPFSAVFPFFASGAGAKHRLLFSGPRDYAGHAVHPLPPPPFFPPSAGAIWRKRGNPSIVRPNFRPPSFFFLFFPPSSRCVKLRSLSFPSSVLFFSLLFSIEEGTNMMGIFGHPGLNQKVFSSFSF